MMKAVVTVIVTQTVMMVCYSDDSDGDCDSNSNDGVSQ